MDTRVFRHFQVFAILVFFLFSLVFASGSAFEKGDKIIQGGLGFLMEGPVGISGVFEYGVHEFVSVGGGMGLSWWNDISPLELSYTEEQRAEFDENDSWPDINLDANGCRTLIGMILSAEPTFIAAMAECNAEDREYFVSKRDKLIAFLTQGIEDGGICASL